MILFPDRRTYQLADTAAYLFRLTVPNTNMGDGHLNFILYPSPTNYRGNPAPIIDYTMVTYANGLVYRYSADGIDNATNQPGEPFNHTVWYSWEPPLPNSGLAQVSVTSSLVSYQVTLDGNGIAANPISCGPADSLLIAVGGSIDTFAVGIDFRTPPGNDELSNAIPVPLGQDFLFYTKYGTMSTNVFGTNTVQGAADLWCIYDPHNESNVSFYISPITNGPSITLQVIQDNQVLGQETVDLINDPPLNITFTNSGHGGPAHHRGPAQHGPQPDHPEPGPQRQLCQRRGHQPGAIVPDCGRGGRDDDAHGIHLSHCVEQRQCDAASPANPFPASSRAIPVIWRGSRCGGRSPRPSRVFSALKPARPPTSRHRGNPEQHPSTQHL